MSAVTSLCLARAIAAHAEASRRADAVPGDDALSAAEAAAMDGLADAMGALASTDDVAAVLAHAYEQGGREAEPGAQGAVMLRLVAALTRRAFSETAAA
ncbi:hypothetical protein D3273_26655 [Lichenibacterium minor]|uniref:Uncharacterized protein n=1 Tax=Lichenibacterium minor TaxID=2316528 RepID=A0A4Q2U2L2_9HYPH|nr:hypothetical protein [Lichenibacterium minor]RYC28925.1 hypothetical protein D3273_26655 [Lichenibacterium minor]